MKRILALVAFALLAQSKALAVNITLSTTTTLDQSGLAAALVQDFTKDTGIQVRTIFSPTGQALNIARHGDADVVLTHDPKQEDAFLAQKFAAKKVELFHNHFLLVGPATGAAELSKLSMDKALQVIASKSLPFVSRGDDSGTFEAELHFWQVAGMARPSPTSGWYAETGQGAGATLNIAVAKSAYTICDEATWQSFKNKGGLTPVLNAGADYVNRYSVMQVNRPAATAEQHDAAARLVAWLASPTAQMKAVQYRINNQQVYRASAQ